MAWFATMSEDTVLVLSREGTIPLANPDGWGLYRNDSRHLSGLELFLNGHVPLLLASTQDEIGALHYVYTNPPEALELPPSDRGGVDLINVAQGSVVMRRKVVLVEGAVRERLEIVNFYLNPLTVEVSFKFAADFADIFEVRGWPRPQRGTLEGIELRPDQIHYQYLGRDQVRRHTTVRFDPAPTEMTLEAARFAMRLVPQAIYVIEFSIQAGNDDRPAAEAHESFEHAAARRAAVAAGWRAQTARVRTDWADLDTLLETSLRDLGVLQRHYPAGPMLVAGLPWYAVPFGRDSMLAAWEMRAFQPELLRSVLRYLAQHQAAEVDDFRDAEPGKIPHEMRDCETSRTGEVPFGPYFGAIDSTPMFVGMLAEAERWLGDASLTDELWPNVLRAKQWLESFGDGPIAYQRRSAIGLQHQGWKDSRDPVSYADGRLAEPPIAMIEVQGYAHWAWKSLAGLAARRGERALAAEAERRAQQIERIVEERFWLPEAGWYAMALADGDRAVAVPSSNMGHAMLFGPIRGERATQVTRRLMESDLSSGWGIRTLSRQARRFNPLSYHNGVVWPHDAALVAAGMKATGHDREAAAVAQAVWEASIRSPGKVLPELISGFSRDESPSGPIPYPLACGPQAWSAAAALSLLTSVLGLSVDGAAGRVNVWPHLPERLSHVRLCGLRVGKRTVDLEFSGQAGEVEVRQLRGEAEIVRQTSEACPEPSRRVSKTSEV